MDATDLPDLLRLSRLSYTVIGEGCGFSPDHVKHVAARMRPATPEFRAAALAFLEKRGAEIADAARRLRDPLPGDAPPSPPAPAPPATAAVAGPVPPVEQPKDPALCRFKDCDRLAITEGHLRGYCSPADFERARDQRRLAKWARAREAGEPTPVERQPVRQGRQYTKADQLGNGRATKKSSRKPKE